jgi:hypothetical protein
MSENNENNETSRLENSPKEDAVLGLQEVPSEEPEVEGHMMGLSTLSGSIIGKCG